MRISILLLFISISWSAFGQKFYLGQQLNPNSTEFKFIGKSSSTGVATYHYVGAISTKYYFGREIDDIILGIKNGIIVTTIYNVIPESVDIGVPKTVIDIIQSNLPFPLSNVNGVYGANIDNTTITISRCSNVLTYFKDRIMFMNSVKQSAIENMKK